VICGSDIAFRTQFEDTTTAALDRVATMHVYFHYDAVLPAGLQHFLEIDISESRFLIVVADIVHLVEGRKPHTDPVSPRIGIRASTIASSRRARR
jgi:hypothetical protein